MSNFTIELKGLRLLYHLLKNKDMNYNDAIKLMEKHNQDMSFLKDIEANYEAEQLLIDENNRLNEEE